MKIVSVLEVASGERNTDAENTYLADGERAWRSLQEQVHTGITQDRELRKLTKRWLKFSKKERKKLDRSFARQGMPSPADFVLFTADDIRAWVERREWPEWVTEMKAEREAD
jgi:hypothetical protein